MSRLPSSAPTSVRCAAGSPSVFCRALDAPGVLIFALRRGRAGLQGADGLLALAAARGGFLYLAVLSVGLGFVAGYRGLPLGGMLRVSQMQWLQPLRSMALSVPRLGETLDARTAAFAPAARATVFVSRHAAVAAVAQDRMCVGNPSGVRV